MIKTFIEKKKGLTKSKSPVVNNASWIWGKSSRLQLRWKETNKILQDFEIQIFQELGWL